MVTRTRLSRIQFKCDGTRWRMGGEVKGKLTNEWVASTLTLPRNIVHPALLPVMRTLRLPVVDWTDVPADLNGLVRFAVRRNLVSARVPSHFKRSILRYTYIDSLVVGSDVTLSRTQVLKAQVHPIYLRAFCTFRHEVSIIRHMEIGFY